MYKKRFKFCKKKISQLTMYAKVNLGSFLDEKFDNYATN